MGIMTGAVLLVAVLYGSVFYDVETHGSEFSKSLTGQVLKNYGGYEYGLFAYETVLNNIKTLKHNAPIYGEAVRKWSEPYVRLGRDVALTGYNIGCSLFNKAYSFIDNQYPVAQNWYVYYFGFYLLPGPIAGVVQGHTLIHHLHSMTPQSKAKKNLPGLRDATINATSTLYGLARNASSDAAQYLRTQVFVGSWSADNIKSVTLEAYGVAFNTTHKYATQTLSWISQTFSAVASKSNN